MSFAHPQRLFLAAWLCLLGFAAAPLQAATNPLDEAVLTLQAGELRSLWAEARLAATAPAIREISLRKFQNQSSNLLARLPEKHPFALEFWTCRAMAAYELGDEYTGVLAGQKMLALGLDQNRDDFTQRTLASLERKDWFEESKVNAALAREQAAIKARMLADRLQAGAFTNSVGMVLIRVDESLSVGKFEVTQAEFQAVMGRNPSSFKGASRPVDSVGWDEATEFCDKLTEKEHDDGSLPKTFAYTLPTERQWAYFAADASLADSVTSQGRPRTSTEPVGSGKPNQLGLHDVRGNVWEWCADWYDRQRQFRTLRGGSWEDDLPAYLELDYRRYSAPSAKRNDYGFRCVLVPVDPDR